jgi:two-component system sensor histidine kinase PilS (NtrC family)
MEVAPGGPAHEVVITDARAAVAQVVTDWGRTVGLSAGTDNRLNVVLGDQAVGVVFDPEHLRRVLVNLLDNAHRHATQKAAAIELRVQAADPGWLTLAVLSDGPPIAPDVEPFLFEPFFSTRSRGSGLGLYICRELCERYGASIDYVQHANAPRMHNEFVLRLRRQVLPGLPEMAADRT